MPGTEIAADWAAQRIKDLSLWKALRAALIGSWGTRNDQFHYPRLGPGMMWETCESRLSAGGSQTMRGVRVEQIAHRNDHVTQVLGRTSQGERLSFETHACISTMPLQELILALTPAPHPKSYRRHANCATVTTSPLF